MATKQKHRRRPPAFASASRSEEDKGHHITGAFLPQTPLGESPPASRSPSPSVSRSFSTFAAERSVFIRWVVDPAISFKMLLLPLILWLNWAVVSAYSKPGAENPFSAIFIISGFIPESSRENPLYRKTWWDIPFIAYYIVIFSFVREYLSLKFSRPLAKSFGIRSEGKLDRFSEQVYSMVYWSIFGAWGYRVMTMLPTYWYNTAAFWNAYPTWALKGELKAYYLIQFAYWWQQLLVLVLGLEKPRKDYKALVAHHFVTIWLIGWSYITNLTLIGNAVYMSMDIPDAFFAFAKLLNYIQWTTAKIYAFGVFVVVWTYFRHYLNFWILWSVWFESSNIPSWTKQWNWAEGVYMPSWMMYQIFLPLALLQSLNLFWYYLILKILFRALVTRDVDDQRSDDEDEDDYGREEKED